MNLFSCPERVESFEQRNPSATQLYKVISETLNSFLAERSEKGRSLPNFKLRRRQASNAETAIKSHERERLEKLVLYMARPAISDERVIIEGPQSILVKLKSRSAAKEQRITLAKS